MGRWVLTGLGLLLTAAGVDERARAAGAAAPVPPARPPIAAIVEPAAGATYVAGETIQFVGRARDADNVDLPASAYEWMVIRRHAGGTEKIAGPLSGTTTGWFTPDPAQKPDPHASYAVFLTVTSAAGLRHTTKREIPPLKVTITLATIPDGLAVKLDGVAHATRFRFEGVAGIVRALEAPQMQDASGHVWQWNGWSDGGPRVRSLATPGADTTFTAIYLESTPPVPPIGAPTTAPPDARPGGTRPEPLSLDDGRSVLR